MIYEIQVQFTKIDKNGNDKVTKEKYIVENAASFGDAEEMGYSHCEGETGLDVISIKRSKIKEIINEEPQDDTECKIYFATIVDKFYDADKDETTETQYVVALHAHDFNEARQAIGQYMSQGFEYMELVGLKCTKYLDVLK